MNPQKQVFLQTNTKEIPAQGREDSPNVSSSYCLKKKACYPLSSRTEMRDLLLSLEKNACSKTSKRFGKPSMEIPAQGREDNKAKKDILIASARGWVGRGS